MSQKGKNVFIKVEGDDYEINGDIPDIMYGIYRLVLELHKVSGIPFEEILTSFNHVYKQDPEVQN